MRDFDASTSFDDDIAAAYDGSLRGDEDDAVACLAELANGGRVLELAIGTGRIGLPLAATGVRVDGIEQSAAMIARLRSKPGGQTLEVWQGNMADVDVAGMYRLVFVVFNSIFNLLTQDEQVRCFAGVAQHLDPSGRFLLEAAMPGREESTPGPTYRLDQQWVTTEQVGVAQVVIEAGRYDPATQLIDKNRVTLGADGIRLDPISLRFAWPSELDLMARLAGLRLLSRSGGWRGEPFTATSRRHVSVYGR